MKYDLKTIINGVEVLDQASGENPSITNVELMDNATDGTLTFGSVALDKLTFTLLNGWKTAYDGDTVEFYVSPNEEEGQDTLSSMESAAEGLTSDEIIDEDNSLAKDETEEEGEDLTEEEETEAEAEEAELTQAIVTQVEGESLEAEEITTDESAEDEWIKVGTYFVYKQASTTDGIRLTCYDSMIFLNGNYTPENEEATVQEHFDAFKTACETDTGVPVEEFTFTDIYNKTITWDFTCSYRDALGYFAGIIGGYAGADENGEVGISYFLPTETILLKDELASYIETSSGEILLDGLTCNRSKTDGLTADEIETGSGQSVKWNNPFIDAEMLEDIFAAYRGVRYTGATVSAKWDTGIQSGTFVRIMTSNEAENWIKLRNASEETTDNADILAEMAQVGEYVFIGTQTVNFGSEAITTIKSLSQSETAKENELTSPWKSTMSDVKETTENYVDRQLVETTSQILQESESITLNLLTEYVTTEDMENYKEEVANTFSITKDGFSFDFDTIKTLVDGLSDEVATQNKYIHLEDGAVIIGDSQSPIKVKITNDSLTFTYSDEPVASFTNENLQVNNIVVEDKDGNVGQMRFGKWAIRPGKTIEGVGSNLNDVWIGG